MADIVTVHESWEADELLNAIERAYAYSDALDDAEALRQGWPEPRPTVLTRVLQDAWDLVQEVRAAERQEQFEADYPAVSQAEFDTNFGVKDA